MKKKASPRLINKKSVQLVGFVAIFLTLLLASNYEIKLQSFTAPSFISLKADKVVDKVVQNVSETASSNESMTHVGRAITWMASNNETPLVAREVFAKNFTGNQTQMAFNRSFTLITQDELIDWPNTIVTAYFEVDSKRGKSHYLQWMPHMLSLQDAMVIFTYPEMVETIQGHRSHALSKTVIIPMQLPYVEIAQKYNTSFWRRQLRQDPLRKQHKSYHIFWIWLSKSFFVTTVIQLNPFQSDVYAWVDIGCFRLKTSPVGQEMILHGRGLIPTDGRILHKAHTEPNPPPYYYWNNNSFDYQHFYHSGSMMIGYKDAWVAFHADFLITVDGFVERDMFIGEDQNVLQSVCLRVPKRCIYLTLKGVKDNPYFGLRYVLHHGGSRRMYGWWYPPEGTPPDSVVVQAKSDGTKERGTPGIPSSRMEPETSRVRQGIEGGTKVVSVMENHTAIPQNPCINQDFVPTSKRAIFTLLMPKKEEYVVAASVLSASIQKHVNETDTVILELAEHPLSRHEWAKLQRAGWTHKCTVPLVKPTFKPSGKFAEQFSKLHVWGMTTYDVALYMDSDTIVLGGLDELFDMKFEAPYKIGVTNDYRFDKNGWVDSFNMGVFVIHPSRDEYERLINLQQQGAVREYEQVMAEQGWLNVVYKDQWKDIGIKFNANIAALRDSKFKAARDDFRIVHFTLYKPWFGGKRLGSIIQEWNDLRNNTVSKYGCINKDFVKPSTHKLALVTFLTDMRMMNSKLMMEDHSDYTYGAAVLLKSIQEHVKKREMDLILLEIPSRPLTDNDRTYLKGLGWNICTVTPIDAKHRPFGRFVDQFNKFHLWSFVEYDKVLYLDSDALVVGNIDSLLDMTLESNQRIGVTQDFFGTRFVDKFNMGVFLIHPNITEFRLLLNLQEHDLVKYDHPQAEQGFLNVLYKDQWKEIGIKFNGNMAVWCQKRSAWPKDPRILHFTLEKGWSYPPPKHRVKSEEPYEVFLDIWKKAARDYGVWPKDNASSQVLEPK